jgi:hypothetical protein
MIEGYIDNEIEWLLYNLWDTSINKPLPFIVPDTVIYKYGKLGAWYFTSKNGMLKQKCKKNLNTDNILKSFSAKNSIKYDISATAYYFSESKESVKISFEQIPFVDIRNSLCNS